MTPPQAVPPQPEDDERPARLAALMWALQAHQFKAEISGDVLTLASPERPAHEVQVRCASRASDEGRLWFIAGDEPLGGAWQITETLTAIKGLTAVRM